LAEAATADYAPGVTFVRVTGVQSSASGAPERIEVEVKGGLGRARFAQGAAPVDGQQLGALVVDDAPVAVSLGPGVLALAQTSVDRLPAVTAGDPVLDEAHAMSLCPLLLALADGLYTIALAPGASVLARAQPGFTADAKLGVLVDVAAASDVGAPVIAALGGGVRALLAGRAALAKGSGAYLIAADVVLDAPGFVARLHDRGAREAFARSPSAVLDDAAFRDALASLRTFVPTAPLGPFTEDRVEPAAQQARALVWDLRAEDGVDEVSDPSRESKGAVTEFVASVQVKQATFDVGFVTRDGRHLHEVVVRSGARFRATGLRPSARGIARTLRQLADEG
jgi:hypothetical protein